MSSEARWKQVDDYLGGLLLPPDPMLDAALAASDAAGLPAISVAPNQGKMLHLLVRVTGARRVLEIGTLGGYSTIWLARGLPTGGRLVTLEYEPRHAEIARANIARVGLADRVEVRVGSAHATLPALAAEKGAPFDLVFIDADKQSYAEYFDWALRLTRPGGLIIADNVIRQGAVADADSADERAVGVRRFYERVAAAGERVSATAVQTVGSKGYDGFALIVVN